MVPLDAPPSNTDAMESPPTNPAPATASRPRRRVPALLTATLALAFHHGASNALVGAQAQPDAATGAQPDAVAQGRALRQRGIGLYREDRFEEAMALYKQALELGPELPENHAYVATACFKLKDVECAERE